MSQIRYDLFHDRYVIIAPNRAQRPGFVQPYTLQTAPKCPFCEGNEALTPPEIYALRAHGGANEKGWRTRVVPNLYKALQIEAELTRHKEGSFEWQEGFGAHEIVIDMPRHELRMDQWSAEELRDWLLTLQERVNDLHRDFRLVWLSVFKNHGLHAGATQPHPHTQILGLPTIPKAKLAQLHHHVAYWHDHGRALYDVLRDEALQQRERVIVENDAFVAIAPFASAFAFEVWVAVKSAQSDFRQMDESELAMLVALLQKLFARMYRVLGAFDFNLSLELAPMQKDGAVESIWYAVGDVSRFGMRIVPRVTGIGGFELSTGMHINPIAPEEAAKRFRSAEV